VGEEEMGRLRRLYDALDRGDPEEFVQGLAHDVQVRIPDVLPWGGTRHGHDGVRAFLEQLGEHVEGSWATPEDFLDAGDRIVVTGRFQGTARATGERFDVSAAHVWACSDGVPVLLQSYLDTATVLRALGTGS
jgi:ketosteroid isomerase-like protein